MPDSITVALIAGGSALVTAILSLSVNAWLGSRRASSDDTRLGMDALREGLNSAVEMADRLTIKLTRLEARATMVLSENNRFRIIHGEQPALSLDAFTPLDDERFDQLLQRLSKMGG